MAAGFVGAVAADGEIRGVRKGGEEGEVVFRGGRGHLGFVAAGEGGPLRGRFGGEAELHRGDAGREVGEPDVIPVLSGELGFRDATGRAANGAEAKAFIGEARGAEADDVDAHETGVMIEGGRAAPNRVEGVEVEFWRGGGRLGVERIDKRRARRMTGEILASRCQPHMNV